MFICVSIERVCTTTQAIWHDIHIQSGYVVYRGGSATCNRRLITIVCEHDGNRNEDTE